MEASNRLTIITPAKEELVEFIGDDLGFGDLGRLKQLKSKKGVRELVLSANMALGSPYGDEGPEVQYSRFGVRGPRTFKMDTPQDNFGKVRNERFSFRPARIVINPRERGVIPNPIESFPMQLRVFEKALADYYEPKDFSKIHVEPTSGTIIFSGNGAFQGYHQFFVLGRELSEIVDTGGILLGSERLEAIRQKYGGRYT